jgi:plastocyanin
MSGFTGERICRNNDVYQTYRNYQRSGSSCNYFTEDRLVERCSSGCSNGYCINTGECDRRVNIDNFQFNPTTVTVSVGSRIIWDNNDNTRHTVTSDNNFFNSGTLDPGEKYSYTFSNAGTYGYHSSFNSDMHGTIYVTHDNTCGGGSGQCNSKCIGDVWYRGNYGSDGCYYSTEDCSRLDSEISITVII